jgi:nucleoid DNA-binding protein
MNKAELIATIADKVDMPKSHVEAVFNATFEVFTSELAAGNDVTIPGFGKLEVRTRGARTGRNPQTGETIQIAESKNVALKAQKALKDAVNG